MALEKFNLEALAKIDGGRLAVVFEQALRRVQEDLHDRPNLKKPRKVEVHITFKPVPHDSDLDSVDVSFQVKDNVPKRESKEYNMLAVRGGLAFNELSPDEVRQGTLDMAPGPKAEAKQETTEKAKEAESNAG